MMPSSGSPTPKWVGGPTPPLVSRGSEEEWKMKIPTGGPPTSVGGKGGVCPYRGERGTYPYSGAGRGASPYSTGGRGASPGRGERAPPHPGRERE